MSAPRIIDEDLADGAPSVERDAEFLLPCARAPASEDRNSSPDPSFERVPSFDTPQPTPP
jgi:hypothetical protein